MIHPATVPPEDDLVTKVQAPLHNVRIVEFIGKGPAPFAVRLLAQLGAEVISIDRSMTTAGGWMPAGERSTLKLDLKDPNDKAQALRIIAEVDVLIEGFRPGVMERLGLGPDACQAVNRRRLIYARMTGWGQTGPRATQAGHDINYISLVGALDAFRTEGRPPMMPLNLLGDYGGGSLYLVLGVLAALLNRRETDHGEVLDVAIIDGVASLMTSYCDAIALGKWNEKSPGENLLDGGAPFYHVYETEDGRYLAIGAIESNFYSLLLKGLGIADDPDLPDQMDESSWPQMRNRFADIIRRRTLEEWCETFADSDACVTPVLSVEESSAEPHMVERNVWGDGEFPTPSAAPRFKNFERKIRKTPKDVDTLLREWGVNEERPTPM